MHHPRPANKGAKAAERVLLAASKKGHRRALAINTVQDRQSVQKTHTAAVLLPEPKGEDRERRLPSRTDIGR